MWSILARTSGSRNARKMLNSRQLALSAAAMCVLAIPVSQAQTSDVPGSDDHPMVTRYEGSVIDGYEVRDYANSVSRTERTLKPGDYSQLPVCA